MARIRIIALAPHSLLLPWALLLCSFLFAATVFGQKRLVDKRDQAQGWFLPVHGKVIQGGERCTDYTLTVYKDNKVLAPASIDKKGRFNLELDIDQAYTVRVSKPGFADKLIYIDTTLPKDQVTYPDYEMTLNLIASGDHSVDPFYADFPSGIIRWNEEMDGFYHNEGYLAHIQSKLTGFAKVQ